MMICMLKQVIDSYEVHHFLIPNLPLSSSSTSSLPAASSSSSSSFPSASCYVHHNKSTLISSITYSCCHSTIEFGSDAWCSWPFWPLSFWCLERAFFFPPVEAGKRALNQEKVGGAVASWLVHSSPDQAVRVWVLAGDIVFCSWARHFTLAVPLSTPVYKWVTTNLMLGVTLRWTSISSREEKKYCLLITSCYRKWDKLRPDGPPGLYADLT